MSKKYFIIFYAIIFTLTAGIQEPNPHNEPKPPADHGTVGAVKGVKAQQKGLVPGGGCDDVVSCSRCTRVL